MIAKGNQRVVNPYVNAWQGGNGSKDLYEGIRQCNVFLDNLTISRFFRSLIVEGLIAADLRDH
jgi:hypothetical protein